MSPVASDTVFEAFLVVLHIVTGPASMSDSPPSVLRTPEPAELRPPSPFLPDPAWQ